MDWNINIALLGLAAIIGYDIFIMKGHFSKFKNLAGPYKGMKITVNIGPYFGLNLMGCYLIYRNLKFKNQMYNKYFSHLTEE